MIVIPAVDIKGGRCVRVLKGDIEKEVLNAGDPVEVAHMWEKKGAEILHVVDLDAATGRGENRHVIKNILKSVKTKVQVGGGIRTLKEAEEILKWGAEKVVVSTIIAHNPDEFKKITKKLGESIIVAIDIAEDGTVMMKGWKEKYVEISRLQIDEKIWGFIITAISKNGTLSGTDIELLKKTKSYLGMFKVIASGGISSSDEIKKLENEGFFGVIVGRALYEGKIPTTFLSNYPLLHR